MDFAISARKLGKRYLIPGPSGHRKKLSELISDRLRHPLKSKGNPGGSEFWALRELDLDVKVGERIGIIGSNGAGKSTLLKILSRLTPPNEGQVRIRGRMASLLEVNTGFHPELSGRENIFLKGAIHGMNRSEILRRFDEIVDFSGVEKFLDMPVKHYSSGMYVRLGFSIAAHLDPEILVMDEVLAVGDASFQQKCLGKMNNSAQEGRTILFVSHNMPAIRSLCQRAIVLESGRKVFDGSSNEGVNRYLSKLGSSRAEQIWSELESPPGNDIFRFKAVRVRTEDGKVTDQLPNDRPMNIEIDYEVLKDSTVMGVTTYLSTYDGEIIFSSLSNHEPMWHAKARPKGIYRSVCTVPGDLLKEGSYRASFLLWASGYTLAITAADAISFEIFDTGSLRGDYFGGMEGSIRPRLEWRCEWLDQIE